MDPSIHPSMPRGLLCSHFLQAFRRNTEGFPNLLRDVISPPCRAFVKGPPPSRHPGSILIRYQTTSSDYLASSRGESSNPLAEAYFHCLYPN